MIDDFKKYLDHLQEKYGDKDSPLRPEWFPRPFSCLCEGVEINPTNSNIDVKLIKKAPQILQPLYEFASGIILPFGSIFTIERALETSKYLPFDKSKWFVFGEDQYFSFWLCSFEEDDEGLSFTSWDHEAHEFEHIEAAWDSIIEFLQFREEEYDESEAHNAQYDEGNIINDDVFGELEYDDSEEVYFRKTEINFFDETEEIMLAVHGSDDIEVFEKEQYESYKALIDNWDTIQKSILKPFLVYYNQERAKLGGYKLYKDKYPAIDTEDKLIKHIKPYRIDIEDEEREVNLYFNCSWANSHTSVGVMVRLGNEIEIDVWKIRG